MLYPREADSTAEPSPVAPPPMISTSQIVSESASCPQIRVAIHAGFSHDLDRSSAFAHVSRILSR